jgi:hypothetical protein
MNKFGIFSLTLFCLMTSACASPVATRISGAGPGLAPSSRLAILAPEADGATPYPELAGLITKSLQARGYSVADDGAYILDVAFGTRPGDIAVFGKHPALPMSASQKQSALSACKKQVHRLTVSVLERASGNAIYQGTAEETHCNTDASNSLPQLVDSITADLAKPGGDRVITDKKLR